MILKHVGNRAYWDLKSVRIILNSRVTHRIIYVLLTNLKSGAPSRGAASSISNAAFRSNRHVPESQHVAIFLVTLLVHWVLNQNIA